MRVSCMSDDLRKEILTRAQFIAWLSNRIDASLTADLDIYLSLVALLEKERNELDELVKYL